VTRYATRACGKKLDLDQRAKKDKNVSWRDSPNREPQGGLVVRDAVFMSEEPMPRACDLVPHR
jgi:hypothetical protein